MALSILPIKPRTSLLASKNPKGLPKLNAEITSKEKYLHQAKSVRSLSVILVVKHSTLPRVPSPPLYSVAPGHIVLPAISRSVYRCCPPLARFDSTSTFASHTSAVLSLRKTVTRRVVGTSAPANDGMSAYCKPKAPFCRSMIDVVLLVEYCSRT